MTNGANDTHDANDANDANDATDANDAIDKNEKQSQKRHMVSGSPCPLISFLDISFSVSFVVRGQRPHRGR